MKSILQEVFLALALMGARPTAALAEEQAVALPTLLIKGEIVSLDTNDPSAVLLKVKDRYGFETPIFLTPETKITQGEKALQTADLTAGASVEVEYNFDINTAKRHAVSVKLASSEASAEAAPAAPEPTAAPASEPAAPEAPTSTPAVQPEPAAPQESTNP